MNKYCKYSTIKYKLFIDFNKRLNKKINLKYCGRVNGLLAGDLKQLLQPECIKKGTDVFVGNISDLLDLQT